MAKYKRSQYLIKKGLQFRYMGVILTAMLLVAAVVGTTVYFAIWQPFTDPTLDFQNLQEILTQGNELLTQRMVVTILLICVVSVFVSHKIAGPVYRLEESAKTIANGNLALRIHLRAGDELGELALAFNNMTESLESMIREDRRITDRVKEVLEGVQRDFGSDKIPEARKAEILKELTFVVEELERVSATFIVKKLEDDEDDDESEVAPAT